MKKGIIVLLIAVLTAGFAFAGFSGNASISYNYDLDSKNHGINNAKSTAYSFTFAIDEAVGESAGEGKVYAEIAATAKAELKESGLAVTSSITKANIVAGDVTIGILGPKGAFNYANAFNKGADGKTAHDFANTDEISGNGFTVSYKGFTAAVSYLHTESAAVAAVAPTKITGNFMFISKAAWDKLSAEEQACYIMVEDDTANGGGVIVIPTDGKVAKAADKGDKLYAGIETPSFEVAEGLKVQAAANYMLKVDKDGNADNKAGVAAKVTYKNEDAKLDVTVAADGQYNNKKVAADFAVTAKYDFITANVYFGTNNSFKSASNYLSAKVAASKTIEAVTVSASYSVFDVIKDEHPWMLADAKVSYAAEAFTCYAGVNASILYGTDAYKLASKAVGTTTYAGLGVSAGISTTALIDNCTVALDWTGSDLSKKADSVAKKGAIAVSATVAF